MRIRGLGYVGLEARSLAPWRPFAEEILGLMPSDDAGPDTLRYRLDERAWRVAVHAADRDGLAYVGWEVADAAALEAAREHLVACGAEPEPEGEGEGDARARGVSGLVRVVDRYGFPHELFYGAPTELLRPFASPAGTSGFLTEHGMGHVLFVVPDAREAEAYYGRLLGLRTTDRMDMGAGKRTIFMRTGHRHHALAVTDVLPEPMFHHVMIETLRMEDVGRAWERVAASKTPVMMTLGQHANDPMLSFYVTSPSGCGVELGWGGTVVDEDAWAVREVGPDELWGHRGADMDAIEEGGGRA